MILEQYEVGSIYFRKKLGVQGNSRLEEQGTTRYRQDGLIQKRVTVARLLGREVVIPS